MRNILSFIFAVALSVVISGAVYAHGEIYESISLVNTGTKTLNSALTTDASWGKFTYVECIIGVESAQGVRFTADGSTTASATVGQKIADGGVLKLHTLWDMQNAVFACGSSTASGTLTVHYSRSQSEPKGIWIQK